MLKQPNFEDFDSGCTNWRGENNDFTKELHPTNIFNDFLSLFFLVLSYLNILEQLEKFER